VPEVKPTPYKTFTRFAILFGLLIILFGLAALLVIQPKLWYRSLPVIVPLALGLALTVGGIASNLGWLADFFLRRTTLVGINVIVMTLVMLAIVVFVNLISTRQYRRWDVTRSRRHTLSDRTLNVLKGLKKELKITALFLATEELEYINFTQRCTELLKEYAARSPRVRLQIIDVAREPDKAALFAKEAKVEPLPDSVVFQYGEKTKQVTLQDMLLYPQLTSFYAQREPPRFHGEEPFTRAIMVVTEEKQTAVYFTTGHGERSSSATDAGGLDALAARLRRDNYDVKTVDLFANPEVPDDCRVLIIAAPRTPFDAAASDAVRRYLQRTNRPGLLALFEPRVTGGNAGGLDAVLQEYNVRVRDDVVMQRVQALTGNLGVVVRTMAGGKYAKHEITDRLDTLGAVFPTACALEVMGHERRHTSGAAEQEQPEYAPITLVSTPDTAWGETNLADERKATECDPEDLRGPAALVVAVEAKTPPPNPYIPAPPPEARGPRLVVCADVDFAANSSFSRYLGNEALLLNAISWLAQKESQIGIPPPPEDRKPVTVNPRNTVITFLTSIVAVPLFVVLLGGIVWWRRRT